MSEWIDVNEKMPRVRKNGFSDYVIARLFGFHVTEARIRNHTEWRDSSERPLRGVRYWMPMPDIPTTDADLAKQEQ